MYQNIRTNHNIDYFTHDKNVSIKRDGKYVIRFVSIFHLTCISLKLFKNCFNSNNKSSSTSMFGKGTSVYITP